MAPKKPDFQILPQRWQDFGLSILFHLLFPLLPIALEFWVNGEVTTKSLTLATSMYSISIGVSSRSRLQFGILLLVGLVFAFAFGNEIGENTPLRSVKMLAFFSIGTIFFFHGVERFLRHVLDRHPYWEF